MLPKKPNPGSPTIICDPVRTVPPGTITRQDGQAAQRLAVSRLLVTAVNEIWRSAAARTASSTVEPVSKMTLSRGLMRAQCVNGATEFVQITHFYPTVKLRVRLLSRYSRALAPTP